MSVSIACELTRWRRQSKERITLNGTDLRSSDTINAGRWRLSSSNMHFWCMIEDG